MFFVFDPHDTPQRWFQSVLLLWNVSCVPLDHLHPIQTSGFPCSLDSFLLTQFCKQRPLEFKTIFKFQGWSTDDRLWVWNVIWNKHPTKMKGLKKREEVREFYGFYSSLSTRLRKFSSSLEKLSHNFTSEKINPVASFSVLILLQFLWYNWLAWGPKFDWLNLHHSQKMWQTFLRDLVLVTGDPVSFGVGGGFGKGYVTRLG